MPEFLIRAAKVSDARAIAEINVAAWRESYGAIMPAEYLAALDVDEWELGWRRKLAGDAGLEVLLVSQGAGEPAGFAAFGPPRSERLAAAGYSGEFHAIYLLRSIQRRGAGRALMGRMSKSLLERGVTKAGAWVFRGNPPARRFYERLGGQEIGLEGVLALAGVEYPDLVYAWPDLAALEAQCRLRIS
jgi:L-amino acid N-acyltransferase YncA